jgi:hypothetical protein
MSEIITLPSKEVLLQALKEKVFEKLTAEYEDSHHVEPADVIPLRNHDERIPEKGFSLIELASHHVLYHGSGGICQTFPPGSFVKCKSYYDAEQIRLMLIGIEFEHFNPRDRLGPKTGNVAETLSPGYYVAGAGLLKRLDTWKDAEKFMEKLQQELGGRIYWDEENNCLHLTESNDETQDPSTA